jgi:putative endonuclease
MNTREKGKKGENIAADRIISEGGMIIEKNFYFKGGELDLIAKDHWLGEDYLCFIEVKMRENTDAGYPEEAVVLSKQKKIIKGAMTYLKYKGLSFEQPIRFDVMSILGDEVKWIKNAFTA